jgi:F0F1-type ATP synthase gamma subunit
MNDEREPQEENCSEVARLLRQIQEEYEAAKNGLTGLALGTSQHDFITKRMEGIEEARENLEQIVGADEAIRLVTKQIEESYKTQELKQDEGDPEKTQELKNEGENK